jgi:hypothetical protein
VIVVVTPVPAIDPGLMVHVPVAGSPFNTTLPVGVAHEEGCVIIPTAGANIAGASLITTSVEGRDMHPATVVTLKL